MYIDIHKILSPNSLLIKKSLIFFVIFFFVCSILNSEHNLPWVSYTSEKYCFISFAFLCCYFLISSQKILLPIIIIPIGLMVFIPVIQYLFGVIVFFETMFFSSMYLFCFFCAVLIGYNFNDRLLFSRLVCNMFLFVGVISSYIVIIQWLDFYNLQPYIIKIQTGRPYANLGQPNQLSTILIISLCSLWYLYEYENKKIYNYIALLLLFSIVLTQSRTAWLVFLCLVIYYFLVKKRVNFSLKVRAIFLYIIFFVFNLIFLPYYNSILDCFNIGLKTSTFYERITTGYSRLDIWEYLYHALLEKPWTGYGWYQTQIANVSGMGNAPTKMVLDSSHNIALDILVWTGLILGIIILLYYFFLFLSIFKSLKTKESIVFFAMILSILIHGFLEYPLFYSYFLLPMGWMIGFVLNENKLRFFYLNKIIVLFLILILIFSMFLVNFGYSYMYNKKIEALMKLDRKEKIYYTDKQLKINFFMEETIYDRTNFIIYWVKFNPYTKLDDSKLISLKKYVFATATKQNLTKYAILLAYNEYQNEAIMILKIIEKLYGQRIDYAQLLDQRMYHKVCKFCD